jgi:hypothetical protein
MLGNPRHSRATDRAKAALTSIHPMRGIRCATFLSMLAAIGAVLIVVAMYFYR